MSKATEIERVFNRLYNEWGPMVDIFSVVNELGEQGIELMKNENYEGNKVFEDNSEVSIKRIGSFIKVKAVQLC